MFIPLKMVLIGIDPYPYVNLMQLGEGWPSEIKVGNLVRRIANIAWDSPWNFFGFMRSTATAGLAGLSIRDEMAQATACKLSGIRSIRFSIIRGLENLLKYHHRIHVCYIW
jgi:hypothetical protein